MENREWDDGLKDMLSDYKPEGLQPDWDEFSNYMMVNEQIGQWEEEAFDENLKESVADFEVPAEVTGWERIESSLNLADQQFDENVRIKINQFEPEYNSGTWALFLKRFTGLGYLRTKLIAFKVVEVAAVILLLFTVVKMGRMGRLPFETPLFQKSDPTPKQDVPKVDMAQNSLNPSVTENQEKSTTTIASSETTARSSSTSSSSVVLNKENLPSANNSSSAGDVFANADIQNNKSSLRSAYSSDRIPPSPIQPLTGTEESRLDDQNSIVLISSKKENDLSEKNSTDQVIAYATPVSADFMATFVSPVQWDQEKTLPQQRYIKQKSRTFTEFGIVSQLDYNSIKMPEDRLFSEGKSITFPQQGITSSGFGGGFSFALGHPRWAIETGMIYSAKNFKPGREFVVGDAFDNGRIEFEEMQLQLITVPLHFRYKIDHRGPFRVYGLTGVGFHLIAQSDIDVSVEYEFPSLSAGEDPNKNPGILNIFRESRKISEHFRDGAPFKTKTFISLNTGAGVEYSITLHKTLFLQSAIQYQIPNLSFSNNNGKHLRSISIQAGVRTPFGR